MIFTDFPLIRTYLRGCLLCLLTLVLMPAWAENRQPSAAWLISIDGAIGPAVADYVSRSIDQAAAAGSPLIILQIDTPGGLDNAMRDIVRSILASTVPVVGYVAPEGARAASAGTYILYACHVAAMAPATNLGAATPVQIGGPGPQRPASPNPASPNPDSTKAAATKPAASNPSAANPASLNPAASPEQASTPSGPQSGNEATQAEGHGNLSAMEKKQINDAVAYIRGLANLRQRNGDWAEQAVREGVSLTATDALARQVVDLIANDTRQLLSALHGRQIRINDQPVTLDTENLAIHRADPDWRSQLLAVITNPNLAYILLLLGIYGLIFEFSSPGIGGPGIIGAICLLLAFYAFQILPISYVGLALIVLGIALMAAEAFAPSFGVLGLGGAAAFVIGSVILMDTDLPGFQIAYPLIGGFAVASFLALGLGLNLALKARRGTVITGSESWIGTTVEALEDFHGQGHVRLQGERWRANCAQPVRKGERLLVQSVEGLTLHVNKQENTP